MKNHVHFNVGKLYNVRKGVIIMKKANILNGWRNPNKDPKLDRPLLVVYRSKMDGFEFMTIDRLGIQDARNHPDYFLLAWRYLPVWKKEGKE